MLLYKYFGLRNKIVTIQIVLFKIVLFKIVLFKIVLFKISYTKYKINIIDDITVA